MEKFTLLLAPFAPHLAEALWEKLGHTKSLAAQDWPSFDPSCIEDDTIEIPLMVNGKVKSRVLIPADADEAFVEKEVMKDPKIIEAIAGRPIKQKKYVPKKIYTLAV